MTDRTTRIIQAIAAVIAVLFGALTVFAGGRVLLGGDPGYQVFLPLLIYNTVMGFVYVVAGLVAWRAIRPGRNAAAVILVLNLAVLLGIAALQTAGSAIAVESLRAMTLRSGVWFVLFMVLWWLLRKSVSGKE